LYFTRSLRWQRTALDKRFENNQPTEYTDTLVEDVVKLDICLNKKERKKYTISFYKREMKSNGHYVTWDKPKHLIFEYKNKEYSLSDKDKKLCYRSFHI
jgi:hypothetical protein